MQPQLYWLDADPLEPEPHATLIGETTTDLCIVGAGYTGLWTALLAKEKNPERNVIIIEQLETGAGASGRNGGFCSYSLTHGFMNGYSRFKDEMAVIERLGRENLEAIEETIKKYEIDCQFELTGEISVANEEWQMEDLIEIANLRNSFGDNVKILSKIYLIITSCPYFKRENNSVFYFSTIENSNFKISFKDKNITEDTIEVLIDDCEKNVKDENLTIHFFKK
jgi:hypothetical protein